MNAVYRRELQGYFYTSVGYIFMGIFTLLASILFYMQILKQRSSDILTFIGQMSYLWMLLSPILTMRLLAEERQRRTDQLLLTSPVSLPGIVLGKYFAALTIIGGTTILTLLFVLIVALYGRVYPGELLTGYLGFLLQGSAFIALDLYLSSCTSKPITAAMLAFGMNFALWIADMLSDTVSVKWIANLLNFFSLYKRNEPFLMGQLSFASIIFDLTFVIAFLLLTLHRMDARRYEGGAS